MTATTLNTPLSDDEYDALDELLAACGPAGNAMDVSGLEGLLTAAAIGPNMLMPDQWLAWVWDRRHGTAAMDFANMDDAKRVSGLIMRHYNHMVAWLFDDPASFEPIFDCGPQWGASEWCAGFMAGMRLDPLGWAPVMAVHPDWFAPLSALAAYADAPGADAPDEAEQDAADADDSADDDEITRLMAAVAPSVINIATLLNAQRRQQQGGKAGGAAQQPVVREVPKVGRNDPCPCGSGKKFKKCCGAGD